MGWKPLESALKPFDMQPMPGGKETDTPYDGAPIDAVYSWVDPSDKYWQLMKQLETQGNAATPDSCAPSHRSR